MTAREQRQRQARSQEQFLQQCIESSQTLDEILEELNLPAQTLAGWIQQKEFVERLRKAQRHLRRRRELQLQVGADRAAALLTRVVNGTTGDTIDAVRRSACVDMIRLARDTRARAVANRAPATEGYTKRGDLFHPAIPVDEAQAIMEELSRREPDAGVRDPDRSATENVEK